MTGSCPSDPSLITAYPLAVVIIPDSSNSLLRVSLMVQTFSAGLAAGTDGLPFGAGVGSASAGVPANASARAAAPTATAVRRMATSVTEQVARRAVRASNLTVSNERVRPQGGGPPGR